MKYDIVEHCNLKCSNCSHFAQFKKKSEKSIEEIRTDLELMVSRVDIEKLYIFGGEPLLHSNLVGVFSTFRKVLGDKVEIRILTNGMKVFSMPESFFLAAKHYNIVIELTEYPINLPFDKIEEKIKSYGIPLILRVTNEFCNFFDPTGKQDPVESFRQCSECHHTYYENGRLFICSYVKNVPFVNQHFGYKIPHESVSVNEPVEVIEKYLHNPCSTCRFCKAANQPEPWRIDPDRIKDD